MFTWGELSTSLPSPGEPSSSGLARSGAPSRPPGLQSEGVPSRMFWSESGDFVVFFCVLWTSSWCCESSYKLYMNKGRLKLQLSVRIHNLNVRVWRILELLKAFSFIDDVFPSNFRRSIIFYFFLRKWEEFLYIYREHQNNECILTSWRLGLTGVWNYYHYIKSKVSTQPRAQSLSITSRLTFCWDIFAAESQIPTEYFRRFAFELNLTRQDRIEGGELEK